MQCLLAVHVSFSGNCLLSSSAHLLDCFLCCCWVSRALCRCWMLILYQLHILQTVSHILLIASSLCWLFPLRYRIFLAWCGSHCLYLLWMSIFLGSFPVCLCLCPCLAKSGCRSDTFQVGFHVGFMGGVLFHTSAEIQFSLSHLLKKLSWLPRLISVFLSKN